MAAPWEGEVSLVRKKLKWKHNPFIIPEEILNEWKKLVKKVLKKRIVG